MEPDRVISEVTTFLGLAPDRSRNAEADTQTADEYSEFYANIHANLNRRPTVDFIDRWREVLSAEDVEVVEAICGGQMKDLGYQPELEAPKLRASRVRRLKSVACI